jgi:formamidopyrimidine-DNA glycosylase
MAIREVLNDAISQGGSSISNYVDANGDEGYFQLSTCVYGKTGEKCKQCKSSIRRILISNRGTHFCPSCQRR